MVVPGAARAIGKKRAYILGGFIAVVGGVAMAFAPGTVPAVGIACYGVLYFGLGLVNTLIFAIQPDTVDYGEWKTGVRGEGSAYSVLSFTRKVGQGVGVPRPRSPSGSEATCRRGGPEGRRRAGDLDTTDGRGGDMTRSAPARRSAGDRRRGVRGASARRQVVRALHAWDAEVFRRTAGRRPWPWSCRR